MDLLTFINSNCKELLHLLNADEDGWQLPFIESINKAIHLNRWFDKENILRRLRCTFEYYASDALINDLTANEKVIEQKTIGLISEERIPMEEITTILNLINAGNKVIYKKPENYDIVLCSLFEYWQNKAGRELLPIEFTDRPIKGFDTLLITGREPWKGEKRKFFEKHHVIEKTRYNSIGIITDSITNEQFKAMASDIFCYYGLGCGNIRKIYIPEGFAIERIFEAIEPWHNVMLHNAYANNFQYHQSVFLMNKIKHLDNGFILLKEDAASYAPIGILHYQYYSDINKLKVLIDKENKYQILSNNPELGLKFGNADKQLLN
ncbi:MAG TPA: hypothetical protein PK252_05720 [Bacteroidales bacterium]|nr:hypothetical protein [Bacteroidales bacterium]